MLILTAKRAQGRTSSAWLIVNNQTFRTPYEAPKLLS